jgi:hypothetical protein
MHKYRTLLSYANRQRGKFILIFVLTLGTSALTALQPWPLKLRHICADRASALAAETPGGSGAGETFAARVVESLVQWHAFPTGFLDRDCGAADFYGRQRYRDGADMDLDKGGPANGV